MPARKKRANWRHPVVYDNDVGSRRRTTRAARGQEVSYGPASSSRSGNTTGSRRGNSRNGSTDNGDRKRQRVRAWVEVHRPPAPGIRFTVPMWIPVDDMTPVEREKYQPQKSRQETEEEESDAGGESEDQTDDVAEALDGEDGPSQATTEASQESGKGPTPTLAHGAPAPLSLFSAAGTEMNHQETAAPMLTTAGTNESTANAMSTGLNEAPNPDNPPAGADAVPSLDAATLGLLETATTAVPVPENSPTAEPPA